MPGRHGSAEERDWMPLLDEHCTKALRRGIALDDECLCEV